MSVFKDSSSIGTEHTVTKQHLLGFRNIFPKGFYWHTLLFYKTVMYFFLQIFKIKPKLSTNLRIPGPSR